MQTVRDRDKAPDLSTLILIVSVSAVIAYGYFNRVDSPNFASRLELHNQIIAGEAPSPYRYRILVPFLAEGFARALSVVLPVRESFLVSYATYDVLAVCLLLTILFIWLRTWFPREQALVGVLFVASTVPVALQKHSFQPWSLLEAGLFSAALLAIHGKRYWVLASLVALATLNRETAIFIPIAFMLTMDLKNLAKAGTWTPILQLGGLCLIWAVVFVGLRYCLGSASHVETVEGLWARNTKTSSVLNTVLNAGLFLGGLWVFACLGVRHAPHLIKRLALIVPMYLATVVIWGMWYEVRLLMPLYPILVPLGLSFLYLRKGARPSLS